VPHRYFTAEIGGGRAALTGQDAHHLADVMRAKCGDTVILCDPSAVEYTGTVTAILPGRVEFSVSEGYPSAVEPNVEVTLFAACPKQSKLEDIIRHSVELGVHEIVPFFSRYCVAAPKNEAAKSERYNRIASEAAKQCGRGILPRVAPALTKFPEVCALLSQYDTSLFFYEGGGVPLRTLLPAAGVRRIAVITGSEGGFAAEEAAAAVKAGAVAVGLGPRILRCETAPLAALAAVMTLTGNLE
jgi:16S rRNA (uracil1498-N3)-methyltransferase